MLKKKRIFKIAVVTILGLIIVSRLLRLSILAFVVNLFHNKDLPKKFANYQSFGAKNILSPKFTMRLISDRPSQSFLFADKFLILEDSAAESGRSLYKIREFDRNGTFIKSYTKERRDTAFYNECMKKEAELQIPKDNTVRALIKPEYFHKAKMILLYGAPGKDPQSLGLDWDDGGKTGKYWQGELFSSIIIGSDTLKVKDSLLLGKDASGKEFHIDGKPLGGVFYRYHYYLGKKINKSITGYTTMPYYISKFRGFNFLIFGEPGKNIYFITEN